MPHLRIETNVPSENVKKNFVKATCATLAKALKKPESYCVVSVAPNTIMSWGSTDDPCAIATLMSIGQLGVKENKVISEALFKHIEQNLGVSKDRMYIHFIDADASNVGYQATTFHEIFGGK